MRKESEQLLEEKGIISKQAELSIKQDGKEFDWWQPFEKRGPGTLWISIDRSNSLSLQIQYARATGRYRGESEGIGIKCQDEGVEIREGAKGSRIYGQNTRARTGGVYDRVDTGQKLGINVSLRGCRVKGKEVECSLNVVTKIN